MFVWPRAKYCKGTWAIVHGKDHIKLEVANPTLRYRAMTSSEAEPLLKIVLFLD